jgi:NIMA (never in mitosis gene a)-related kinase
VFKVGDLNVSKVQDSSAKMANTQTGTPYYASPEVWRDEPYDFKSDIWSLGCVLYEMCTHRPPFQGKDLESLYNNVQKGFF